MATGEPTQRQVVRSRFGHTGSEPEPVVGSKEDKYCTEDKIDIATLQDCDC